MTDVQELIERLQEQRDRDAAEHCPAEIIVLQHEAISALQQQAAEIERLKTEAEMFKRSWVAFTEQMKDVAAERDALQAKLDEAEKQEPVNQSLAEDIEAIDVLHRGDPSYEHDAYWVRKAASDAIRKGYALYTRPIPAVDVNAGLVEALQLCYDHCRLYHPEVERNNVGETVRAALSQSQAAPARVVEDGWKLVPMEATEEMETAWDDAHGDGAPFHAMYAALLAAAPQPKESA